MGLICTQLHDNSKDELKPPVYKRTIVKRSAPHGPLSQRVREWLREPESWRGPWSLSPEKARCPFKRPRISRPAFLPGAPAVIDAGRREEAPGANKSPARRRAASGHKSLLTRGTATSGRRALPGEAEDARGRREEAAEPDSPGQARLGAHAWGPRRRMGTPRRRRGEPRGGTRARAQRGAAPTSPERGF